MAATAAEAKRAGEILSFLDQDETADEWVKIEHPHHFEEVLRSWVEIALTQLVLILDDTEVVFAQAVRGEGGSGRIIVFTGMLVAVSEVADPLSGAAKPRTIAVARRQIQSLAVTEGSRVVFDPDNHDNRGAVVRWPGTLGVVAEYVGIETPIAMSGASMDRWERGKAGLILTLLSGLRADLAVGGRAAQPGT